MVKVAAVAFLMGTSLACAGPGPLAPDLSDVDSGVPDDSTSRDADATKDEDPSETSLRDHSSTDDSADVGDSVTEPETCVAQCEAISPCGSDGCGGDCGDCAGGYCAGDQWIPPQECSRGSCKNRSAQVCFDRTSCTGGSCVAGIGCVTSGIVVGCIINGTCYANGEAGPPESCRVCNAAASTTSWSMLGEDKGSCRELIDCVQSCPSGEAGSVCVAECKGLLSPSGLADYQALQNCLQANSCSAQPTMELATQCIETFCVSDYVDCVSGCLHSECSELKACLGQCDGFIVGLHGLWDGTPCEALCWSDATPEAQLDMWAVVDCVREECALCTPSRPGDLATCTECWHEAEQGKCVDVVTKCGD